MFPLSQQHPSGMNDWKEDEMDPSYIIPEESGTLLPSFKRKEKIKKRQGNIVSQLNKLVVQQDKIIDNELFKRYLGFQSPFDMQKELFITKNTDKNKELIHNKKIIMIKSRLVDLDNDIEKMFEDEIEYKEQYDVLLKAFFILIIKSKKDKD